MAGSLGELEQLLLMALLRCDGVASGIDLRSELEKRTGREVLPGAVYNIMERMRERGLVDAFTGDRTPARGGRRRKYYRLQPSGERELARAWREVRLMVEGLDERLARIPVEP